MSLRYNRTTSYNEYLRNKKRSLPQVISPTRVDTAGLHTQIMRYNASVPQDKVESAGTSLLHSSGSNVLATKGNVSVCCGPAQATVTVAGCCPPNYNPYPRAGYAAPRPDCPPINNGPIDPSICYCR